MKNRQTAIVSYLKELGISLVGFGKLLPNEMKSPGTYSVAISLIVKYDNHVINKLDSNPELFKQKRSDIIEIFKKATSGVEKLLKDWGYKVFVPSFDPKVQDIETLSNDFSHKRAATAAGLGWIGKSSLLITPQYGPRVRLATILTSAEFETSKPITEDKCGTCTLCVDACPIGIIKNKNWSLKVEREELIDARLCYEKGYDCNSTSQKYRCGKCLQVCHVGCL